MVEADSEAVGVGALTYGRPCTHWRGKVGQWVWCSRQQSHLAPKAVKQRVRAVSARARVVLLVEGEHAPLQLEAEALVQQCCRISRWHVQRQLLVAQLLQQQQVEHWQRPAITLYPHWFLSNTHREGMGGVGVSWQPSHRECETDPTKFPQGKGKPTLRGSKINMVGQAPFAYQLAIIMLLEPLGVFVFLELQSLPFRPV